MSHLGTHKSLTAWCRCMVQLHGAAAWCCCVLLLHGAAAPTAAALATAAPTAAAPTTAAATAADAAAAAAAAFAAAAPAAAAPPLLLVLPLLLLPPLLMLSLLLLQRAACSVQCAACSSNFLIYHIEAAIEAAPAIFGRYLVTQWRQLLAAADAFRAEHWVQSRR